MPRPDAVAIEGFAHHGVCAEPAHGRLPVLHDDPRHHGCLRALEVCGTIGRFAIGLCRDDLGELRLEGHDVGRWSPHELLIRLIGDEPVAGLDVAKVMLSCTASRTPLSTA